MTKPKEAGQNCGEVSSLRNLRLSWETNGRSFCRRCSSYVFGTCPSQRRLGVRTNRLPAPDVNISSWSIYRLEYLGHTCFFSLDVISSLPLKNNVYHETRWCRPNKTVECISQYKLEYIIQQQMFVFSKFIHCLPWGHHSERFSRHPLEWRHQHDIINMTLSTWHYQRFVSCDLMLLFLNIFFCSQPSSFLGEVKKKGPFDEDTVFWGQWFDRNKRGPTEGTAVLASIHVRCCSTWCYFSRSVSHDYWLWSLYLTRWCHISVVLCCCCFCFF